LFLAKYNDKNRQISYINAGHNPPVLWMDGRATQLATGTTILGAFEDLPFINSECLTLQSNSLIFNYTDGLVESADEDVFISCNQLIECIKSNQYLPVDELNLNILKDIRTSQNANMDSDDITLFTLKIF
jgi:sigma-B regulation protein RsbU (phosphoserine phosphatase)